MRRRSGTRAAIRTTLIVIAVVASARTSGAQANNCTQRCRPVIDECARITTSPRPGTTAQQAQQAGAACASRIQACVTQCSAANPSAQPQSSPFVPGTAAEPAAPPASAAALEDFGNDRASAEAAYQRLLQTWLATDQRRLAELDRTAQKLVSDVLQVLCRQLATGPCTTGTGEAALPPLPSTSLRAGQRWSLGPSRMPDVDPTQAPDPAGGGAGAQGARGKKTTPGAGSGGKREGCYLEIEAHVAGGWGSDKLSINTPLSATFYPELQGDKLFVTSNSNKPAYLGYRGHPTQHVIPPNSKVVIPFGPIHRSKDDTRMNEADIVVKYWSDDADKCEKGAVRPGLTTPEEWGASYGPGAGDHRVVE